MAKKLTPLISQHKCSVCGQPLTVNEHGIPVTSLYKMGYWYCENCKYKGKEAHDGTSTIPD